MSRRLLGCIHEIQESSFGSGQSVEIDILLGSDVGASYNDTFRSEEWPVYYDSEPITENYVKEVRQSARSQSVEEYDHHSCSEFCSEIDASRTLSRPLSDTAVKTRAAAAATNDVSFHRTTQQSVNSEPSQLGDVGIFQRNGMPVSVSSSCSANSARNQPMPCSVSVTEGMSAEDTDGPEPDISLSQPARQPAALYPTVNSSASDSGYIEEDSVSSPLSQLLHATRISNTFAHKRLAVSTCGPVTLRKYQLELAEPGCRGSNCIICAPTGSGKTFTAGYICRTRRDRALAEQRRFKCLFVVCIRNLIIQQRDALTRIMPETGVVCGVDDKLTLSEYFKAFDVVIATAQLFLNALKMNEMKINDIDMLIMDECHHTILSHPYNAIMENYYTTCRQNSSTCLPQIIGLTASLGVGAYEDDPRTHYVRICANLDCECITYVKDTDSIQELLEFNPRPQRDQIVPVDARSMETDFVLEVVALMVELFSLREMVGVITVVPHDVGTQQFENWIVQIKLDADKRDDCGFIAACAGALQRMNAALLVYKDLRIRDSFAVLEDYFNDNLIAIPGKVRELYKIRRAALLKHVDAEPLSGDNPKLHVLCDLLDGLFSSGSDPRGILLAKTRLIVSRLVDFVSEQPQLKGRVFVDKLVGQGQRDGTMTDVQQENTLRRFRADSNDQRRCNLLIATDVAQEGLDMPKCNFVIRYNFVSNEIGSVQSRGRARAPNSECYLIVDRGSVNERREYENLEKEHLMLQALAEINDLPQAQLRAMIATERERLWAVMQQKKQKKSITSSLLDAARVEIHCRACKAWLCTATDMRMRCSNYICVADDILDRIEVKKSQKRLEFRLDYQNGPTLCRKCHQKVGLEIEYKQGIRPYGYAFSKDNVMWRYNAEDSYRPIKKWSAVPFTIEEETLFPVG